jgi:hypothetical protein
VHDGAWIEIIAGPARRVFIRKTLYLCIKYHLWYALAMIPISADMKLQRAHVHLDALNVKVSAWINSKPYTITPETDFQRGEYVITTVIQDVPMEFSAIAGDFIHNLRGALDHLAWILAAVGTNHTRPSDSIYFPVFHVFDNGTPAKIAKCTKGIDPVAVAIMQSLQPYHSGSGYKDTHLWRLNKLWNIDKHRHLALHSAVLNSSFSNIPQSARASVVLDATDDGHVVRVPLASVMQDVKFDPRNDLRVYFGDEAEGIRVTTNDFLEMYEFVKNTVFPRFQRYLA